MSNPRTRAKLGSGRSKAQNKRNKPFGLWLLFGFWVLVLCVLPAAAAAQISPLDPGDCGMLGIKCSADDNAGTLRTYMLTVINVFLGLVGVVALVFVITGGVRYVSSQGDESAAESGKKTILYAVLGIILVGIAAVVVNFTLQAADVEGAVPGGSDLVVRLLFIINFFLALVGVVALAFVLTGGVRYITSQGDEGATEKAKQTILYAVLGIIVVGLSAVLVNFTALSVGLGTGLPGGNNLSGTILVVINFFLALLGVTALTFVLIGGVRYITSRGEESATESAKRTIFYAVIGIIVVGLAAVLVNFTALSVGLPTGLLASNDLPTAILILINFFLILAALTALIVIIYAGVQYITSQGDQDKAQSAKRTILYAVVGLLVIGLAAVTVNFVISAFL